MNLLQLLNDFGTYMESNSVWAVPWTHSRPFWMLQEWLVWLRPKLPVKKLKQLYHWAWRNKTFFFAQSLHM